MARLLLLLAVLAPCVFPLYFHIKESETKCFIEELPEETMVVGLGAATSPFREVVNMLASRAPSAYSFLTARRQLPHGAAERRRLVQQEQLGIRHPRGGGDTGWRVALTCCR